VSTCSCSGMESAEEPDDIIQGLMEAELNTECQLIQLLTLPDQDCVHAEIGFTEVGFTEVGFTEVGFTEVGFTEVGFTEEDEKMHLYANRW